jgi:hypothetical protein
LVVEDLNPLALLENYFFEEKIHFVLELAMKFDDHVVEEVVEVVKKNQLVHIVV